MSDYRTTKSGDSSRRSMLEVCVGSVADGIRAAAAGADRIELNSALEVGGLTPSNGAMFVAAAEIPVPIVAMIRPHAAHFSYDRSDLLVMWRDINTAVKAGLSGIAIGVLDGERRVNRRVMAEVIDRAGALEVVFHRAFDLTPDPVESLETLVEIGVKRILTSGQAPSAPAGAGTLKSLVHRAKNRIEILPGSGIRPGNVTPLILSTGCTQVHASCSRHRAIEVSEEPGVDAALEGRWALVLDTEQVVDLRKKLDELYCK